MILYENHTNCRRLEFDTPSVENHVHLPEWNILSTYVQFAASPNHYFSVTDTPEMTTPPRYTCSSHKLHSTTIQTNQHK